MFPIPFKYLAQVARAGRYVAFPPLGEDLSAGEGRQEGPCIFSYMYYFSLILSNVRSVHTTNDRSLRVEYLCPAIGRRGIDSRNRVWNWVAKLHRLAGRYDNPMPTWFLARIAGLKLPTQHKYTIVINTVLTFYIESSSLAVPNFEWRSKSNKYKNCVSYLTYIYFLAVTLLSA